MHNQDNHMEELFRRAAENYLLKTGESNWDDISPLLGGNTQVAGLAGNKKGAGKNLNRILPLLLLLLTGGALTAYFSNTGKKQGIVSANKINTAAVENNSTINNNNTRNNESISLNEENKLAVPAVEEIRTVNHPNKNIVIITPVIKKTENQSLPAVALTSLNEPTQNVKPAETIFFEQTKDAVINKETNPAAEETTNTVSNKNEEAPITLNKKENESTTAAPVIKNKTKKQNGLYAGAIIGVGYNAVKNQALTKPGLELGLRAGYRFNKNLSAETEIIFDKKYYYSDGKYFNMVKVATTMPTGMKVLSLHGSSSVFEIPIKIKYNFLLNNNRKIFATAGVTSLILSKEKNDYLALLNGSKQNISTVYNQSHNYFAAAIDLSIGYEFNIQKNKTLRIEPYLQVPLKGIGVGAMPVTGVGLHIGYTLFKH